MSLSVLCCRHQLRQHHSVEDEELDGEGWTEGDSESLDDHCWTLECRPLSLHSSYSPQHSDHVSTVPITDHSDHAAHILHHHIVRSLDDRVRGEYDEAPHHGQHDQVLRDMHQLGHGVYLLVSPAQQSLSDRITDGEVHHKLVENII